MVTFATAREAANAISTLNQTSISGRAIFVREDARPPSRPPRPAEPLRRLPQAAASPGGNPRRLAAACPCAEPAAVARRGRSARRAAGTPPRGAAAANGGGTRVYVGNLAWETSWQDLKDHFRQAGEVTHADVMVGRAVEGCWCDVRERARRGARDQLAP